MPRKARLSKAMQGTSLWSQHFLCALPVGGYNWMWGRSREHQHHQCEWYQRRRPDQSESQRLRPCLTRTPHSRLCLFPVSSSGWQSYTTDFCASSHPVLHSLLFWSSRHLSSISTSGLCLLTRNYVLTNYSYILHSVKMRKVSVFHYCWWWLHLP